MLDQDFEAVNRLAIEQISRLEGNEGDVKSGYRGNFWSEDPVKSLRPSSAPPGTRASVPLFRSGAALSYYSSKRDTSTFSTPDAFYRKILNAVYRQERTTNQTKQEDVNNIIDEPVTCILGGSLFGTFDTTTVPLMSDVDSLPKTSLFGSGEVLEVKSKMPHLSEDLKHQLLAIALGGAARVFTTMVVNYARDRRIPYELM